VLREPGNFAGDERFREAWELEYDVSDARRSFVLAMVFNHRSGLTPQHLTLGAGVIDGEKRFVRTLIVNSLIALTVYAFAGYPVVLWIVTRFKRMPIARADITPPLSIIIPAHNEEAIILDKLNSILQQDYPIEQVEVLVASDGSTDSTVAIARGLDHPAVRVLDFERAGKAATLNRAVEESRHSILIFTDANAILAPGALRALAANFADDRVGGVSANEVRRESGKTSPAGRGERLYWEYDKWLKRAESEIGSIVAASGSLYAIRRSLFRPISDPAATDDFAISTQVIRAGKRLVFEACAITWEPPMPSGTVEFNRRVRIVTRGLRSVWGIRDLLLPWRSGFYALQLWSHKVIRRFVGFFGAGILIGCLSLWRRQPYRLLTIGQILMYALAFVGWLGQDRTWARRPWFYIPYYFCLSNAAATLGVLAFLRQRRVTIWEPRRDD
jgi:cellulose synthase/poly-beta-1,6-N-acetylglucosamine synthase-like glycosyltransferase